MLHFPGWLRWVREREGQGASVQTQGQAWMWPLCKMVLSGSTSCWATASFPLLPLRGTPKTWAFISWAKYPRSLQSLSFLALRQSDNYLFSFPLLLASREVFWLALVCMKYYQNIAHFSILQPLTQEIWSHRICDWHVSVFHVPLRIAALFWSYSKHFDGSRNECVMFIKPLLLCITSVCHYFWAVLLCVSLFFFTYGVGVSERTDFLNLYSSVSFPHGRTLRFNRAACASCRVLVG